MSGRTKNDHVCQKIVFVNNFLCTKKKTIFTSSCLSHQGESIDVQHNLKLWKVRLKFDIRSRSQTTLAWQYQRPKGKHREKNDRRTCLPEESGTCLHACHMLCLVWGPSEQLKARLSFNVDLTKNCTVSSMPATAWVGGRTGPSDSLPCLSACKAVS